MANEDFMPDLNTAPVANVNPKAPCGTFEITILGMRAFKGGDPQLPADPLFGLDFRIDEIINQEQPLPPDPIHDKNPPAAVVAGQICGWTANVKPDPKGQPAKSAALIRDLLQACLRFEPRSRLADSAVDAEGKPVNWNDVGKEARSEENPLAGCKVRVTFSRIVTRRGQGFAMYLPAFQLSKRVEARKSNVVDGL